ncbi:MAG: flagellar biosynthesis protein FlhB [Pseudomonadota bacterium]
MAEDQDDAQKTEEPTPRKLEQAREKGQVPVSQEVKHWFVLLGGLVVIGVFAPYSAQQMTETLGILLVSLHEIPTDGPSIQRMMAELLSAIGWILLIPAAVLIIMALAGGLVQNGLLFTTEPIIPKLNKISPIAGLKRLFSLKSLVESGKGILKIAIIGAVCGIILAPDVAALDALAGLDPLVLAERFWWLAIKIIGAALAVMSVIAAIDFAYQRMEFMKQQRMTMQEVKDEYKQTEGDPMVKGRIRQIRMERARQRMMASVPNADVVVTNPTHFAVALKYEPGEMEAPICVAKGADNLAFKIREIAEEHGIAVIENPPLARALYPAIEIDQEVPEEHYKAVAEVISYVFRLQRRHLN